MFRIMRLFAAVILYIALPCAYGSEASDGGVLVNESSAFNGYTLFNPQGSQETVLIDNGGRVVHSWTSEYRTGSSVYLLENGDLLRTATVRGPFSGAGGAGRVERFSWDGDLLWSFEYADDLVLHHHDVEMLPGGNVLMIAWERIGEEALLKAGREPALLPKADTHDRSAGQRGPGGPSSDGTLWVDHLIEVNEAGNIVWEWHAADHFVQEADSNKENYGVVAEHPELININYMARKQVVSDWTHINSVDYNADLDQIILACMSSVSFGLLITVRRQMKRHLTPEATAEKGEICFIAGEILRRMTAATRPISSCSDSMMQNG